MPVNKSHDCIDLVDHFAVALVDRAFYNKAVPDKDNIMEYHVWLTAVVGISMWWNPVEFRHAEVTNIIDPDMLPDRTLPRRYLIGCASETVHSFLSEVESGNQY